MGWKNSWDPEGLMTQWGWWRFFEVWPLSGGELATMVINTSSFPSRTTSFNMHRSVVLGPYRHHINRMKCYKDKPYPRFASCLPYEQHFVEELICYVWDHCTSCTCNIYQREPGIVGTTYNPPEPFETRREAAPLKLLLMVLHGKEAVVIKENIQRPTVSTRQLHPNRLSKVSKSKDAYKYVSKL